MPDTTALDRDLERRQRQLEQLDRLAQRFGTSLSTAFAKNAADGRRLDDVLNSVGRTLAQRQPARRHEAAAQRSHGAVQERARERRRRRDRARQGRRHLARPGDALREGRRRRGADLLPARPRPGAHGERAPKR